MALALFDLDNTLLNGDSDHSWGLYLSELGVLDSVEQERKQDYFYQQYLNGNLDIYEFLEFQLAPLTQFSIEQLHQWRQSFIEQKIWPMLKSGKTELLDKHLHNNDQIVIITATNDFITRPIANLMGVSDLIATEAEMIDGLYTGKCHGTPCFQNGKVERLEQWLRMQEEEFGERYFYTDSINDLPLLKAVDVPIAVTPDDKLRAYAKQRDWSIID